MYDAEANMVELSLTLQKLAKKYTLNDSSTMTIELAQKLLNAILYSINFYLDSLNENNTSITTANIELDSFEMYEKGQILIKKCFENAHKSYICLKNNILDVHNLSYYDTISNGLGQFFEQYNIQYQPHETPGSIDYQLFMPIDGLEGIRFIDKYIKLLEIENNFLIKFDMYDINALLKGYSADSDALLINVYGLVLLNALGLQILKKDIRLLDISYNDKNKLYSIFSSLSIFDIENMFEISAKDILCKFNISDDKSINYILKSSKILSKIIKNSSETDFYSLFITCDYSKNILNEIYIDGEMMNDEKLRSLIEIINDCANVDDKLNLIKQEVHSLSDLTEVLENSIWNDEYNSVFETLDNNELDYLMNEISNIIVMGTDIDELKEWQKKLIIYVNLNS